MDGVIVGDVDDVVWHDVECGSYAADLPLWRELAAARPDPSAPVLDLGAGTGRVALDLAAAGVTVYALDVEPTLLAALADRAAARGLADRIVTVEADARDFRLPDAAPFDLILAPMQTVQLLGGAEGRAGMLRSARAHLAPGGLLAAAIAHQIDAFDEETLVPMPDVREIGGVVYSSRPVAIREDTGGFVLERLRERVGPDGTHEATEDRIRLDRLRAAAFEEEARALGFTIDRRRAIAETADHVGSEVAMLRA